MGILTEELARLQSQLNNKKILEGSDEWLELQAKIHGVHAAI